MKNVRSFCAAFAITACVVGLGVGLYAVGYNSHRMTHGDEMGGVLLKDGKLYLAATPIQPTPLQTNQAVMPAPIRLSVRLLERVALLAEKTAATLSNS